MSELERGGSPRLTRKDALAITSLFLLSAATPEITSSVWSHDIHRWQKGMDPRRRNVLAAPTLIAIFNKMELKGMVDGFWEPAPESVNPREQRPPRKYYRPTPPGELIVLDDAIPSLKEDRAAPHWLPESLLTTPPLPSGFEFTLPIGPLRKLDGE